MNIFTLSYPRKSQRTNARHRIDIARCCWRRVERNPKRFNNSGKRFQSDWNAHSMLSFGSAVNAIAHRLLNDLKVAIRSIK